MTTESTPSPSPAPAAFTPVRSRYWDEAAQRYINKPPRAFMVFDGDAIRLPPHWPAPLPDQMQGTKHEQLIELAGRVCYDSIGMDADGKRKGRPSLKFHDHLIEVGHNSVLEHAKINLEIDLDYVASTFREVSRERLHFSVLAALHRVRAAVA